MLFKPLPPINKLQRLFTYDPCTGLLYWRIQYTNRVKPGMRAGKLHPPSGYMHVTIDSKRYPVHRVCWALHYGEDPPHRIDHRDTDRANNQIANIRRATQSQNAGNSRKPKRNTSGFKGVHYDPKRKKFAANIRIKGRLKYLGRFDTAIAAKAAYDRAGVEVWGPYFNPG